MGELGKPYPIGVAPASEKPLTVTKLTVSAIPQLDIAAVHNLQGWSRLEQQWHAQKKMHFVCQGTLPV